MITFGLCQRCSITNDYRRKKKNRANLITINIINNLKLFFFFSKISVYFKIFFIGNTHTSKMDQNLLNFWKNYEYVINWGYRISGDRLADASGSTVPINTQKRV